MCWGELLGVLCTLGSDLRYMICVTPFCHVPTAMRESRAILVRFSHGRRFFDSLNVQKRATKSNTSGHCLGSNCQASSYFVHITAYILHK